MFLERSEILKGKNALVTGGTAGIGKAIAQALGNHGAKVVICGTNQERGENAAKEIPNCRFIQLDVSQYTETERAIKEILDTEGQIDILINNAGITRDQLLMKMTEEDWDKVIDINLKSCYNTCHALVRPMMKARSGSIVNVSSVIGLTGNAGQMNYAAAKAGMIGLTKSLAKELAARKVRANCVCPGFIDTSMTQELTEEQRNAILTQIPLGRMGKPEEIANMVLFLVSPAADYITGQVFVVDGGMV